MLLLVNKQKEKSTMKKSAHLGIKIDPELHDKLKYIARYEGRSMSGQILYLITSAVRAFEKEHGEITPEEIASVK